MGCFPPSSLHADERGSVVAVSDASGAVTNINSYDEYGIPCAGNVGRFQYTRAHEPCRGHGEARSQAWLAELGMYYYKARIYSPTLGRFLQTDPIGYGDGLNWYNYVGGDPVNATDPSGLCAKNEIEIDGECVSGVDVRLSAHVELIGVRNGGGGGFGFYGGPINTQRNQFLEMIFGAVVAPILTPPPPPPLAEPKPPKAPSKLEQCLVKAAENYANGEVHREDGIESWTGGARTSLGNPFRKDGMLTPGPTALGFIANFGRAAIFHIVKSCK